MAIKILNFSDSEDESDKEVKLKKVPKKIGFKPRNRQLKPKVTEDDSKSNISIGLIDNEDQDQMEDSMPIIIKKSNVKFQAKKPQINDTKGGFNDLISKYGNISSTREILIRKEEPLIEEEGFYLDPESMDEDEDEEEDVNHNTGSINKSNQETDLNIREVEMQMLNEEFIPVDLESVKKTRQVLERDTIALQLDDDDFMVDDDNGEHGAAVGPDKFEKSKREMIQMALNENAVEGSEAMSILISNPNIVVSYEEIPDSNSVLNRIREKMLKLESLHSKQEVKLLQFKSELGKIAMKSVEKS